MYYGFEYFCGANVTVRINNIPVLEAAGISMELSSTKRPLWGYSSVHFDAVGRGQDIVNGTLIVNYVHEDYLFRLLETSIGAGRRGTGKLGADPTPTQQWQGSVVDDIINQAGTIDQLIAEKKTRYWYPPEDSSGNFLHDTSSVVDWGSGVQIKIVFGHQDFNGFKNHGETGVLLEAVHFTGESKVIRIDEETIVEAYPFFARNRYSIRNPNAVSASDPADL